MLDYVTLWHWPKNTENTLWSMRFLIPVSPEGHQESYNSPVASPLQRLSHRGTEDTRYFVEIPEKVWLFKSGLYLINISPVQVLTGRKMQLFTRTQHSILDQPRGHDGFLTSDILGRIIMLGSRFAVSKDHLEFFVQLSSQPNVNIYWKNKLWRMIYYSVRNKLETAK